VLEVVGEFVPSAFLHGSRDQVRRVRGSARTWFPLSGMRFLNLCQLGCLALVVSLSGCVRCLEQDDRSAKREIISSARLGPEDCLGHCRKHVPFTASALAVPSRRR
jgi:hypothetical protein